MEQDILNALNNIVIELQKLNNINNNTIDLNSLFSVLVGAIAGGLFSLLGTRYGIKKQFELQSEQLSYETKIKEKRALLIFKDEVKKNIIMAESLKKYADTNKTDFIEVRKLSNTKLEDSTWNQFKGDVLFLLDTDFTKKLTDYYIHVYMMNHCDQIGYSAVLHAIEQSNELSLQIDKLLKRYE